jgi:hypothetical protein
MREGQHRRLKLLAVAVVILCLKLALTLPPADAAGAGSMSGAAAEPCVIRNTAGAPVQGNSDALARLLHADGPCPADVFEFRSRLAASGATIRTTLVANRGFHDQKKDPEAMHFMMFEMVTGRLAPAAAEVGDGEFFFGHFTAVKGANTLFADQRPSSGALMVELIAFDPSKGVFNFYELIGDGRRGRWFYRGDSLDIQGDVKLLHRQDDPRKPQFGERLRCSGCHTGGGPIMKELALPHNDWSTAARPLTFGGLKPDAALAAILKGVVDADELAKGVRAGASRLAESGRFRQALKALPLQEKLRPLFCPVEVNIESDLRPLDEGAASLQVPSAFFVNPLFAEGTMQVGRADYDAALKAARAFFPETARADADHGWLTPVKGFSDMLAVAALVKDGIVSQEFVGDVLAVDMTNPSLSTARCSLLRLLPADERAGWQEAFEVSLRAEAGRASAAQELLSNLSDPARDMRFHQARAARILQSSQARLKERDAVVALYGLLAQRRAEVSASEISKNSQGQILEPGFRIIFPMVIPEARATGLSLTDAGRVVRQ